MIYILYIPALGLFLFCVLLTFWWQCYCLCSISVCNRFESHIRTYDYQYDSVWYVWQ